MNLLNVLDLGLTVTFSGLVIVFAMLILLVMILSLFGVTSTLKEKREQKKLLESKREIASAEVVPVENTPELNDSKNDEIIAVISAAVASIYSQSNKKPVIKSIKRSMANRSAWASAGIIDNTRAF